MLLYGPYLVSGANVYERKNCGLHQLYRVLARIVRPTVSPSEARDPMRSPSTAGVVVTRPARSGLVLSLRDDE